MLSLDDLRGLVLFVIGASPVTLGGVIAGLLIIGVGWLVARLASGGIRRLRARVSQGVAALYIMEKLVGYGFIILAVIAGFSTIGLDLSSLAVFAGALGVGVGLGLQGVVKQFISGLVLIFDRSLSVGDFVELEDGRRGTVHEVGTRAVRIRTNDNVDLIVPNSKFIEGPVINWTQHGATRRIRIPFSVGYGCDRERVRDVVLAAARTVPFTLPETETEKSQVWLSSFGDSGLNFDLVVWPTLEAVKRPASMNAAYIWAIADALEQAGLEIPFPQTDLRVRSLFGREGDEALEVLGLSKPATTSSPPPTPTTTPRTNDAADDLTRQSLAEAADAPEGNEPG